MISPVAQPKCPYCLRYMRDWGTRAPAKQCELCDRPLILLPASLTHAKFRILSLVDVLKIIMLPIVGAGLVTFVTGTITTDGFARVIAAALLVWGSIDVWDGTAGLKTGIDRVKRQVRADGSARRMSLAKTIFGLASVLLGSLGLLLAS